jgi:hypothetical protein
MKFRMILYVTLVAYLLRFIGKDLCPKKVRVRACMSQVGVAPLRSARARSHPTRPSVDRTAGEPITDYSDRIPIRPTDRALLEPFTPKASRRRCLQCTCRGCRTSLSPRMHC